MIDNFIPQSTRVASEHYLTIRNQADLFLSRRLRLAVKVTMPIIGNGKSKNSLENSISLNFVSPMSHIIIQSLLVTEMDIEYSANQYKEQGNQAYKTGDYKRALTLYSKAVTENPKESTFYFNRALCYFNLKKYQDCVRECNTCLSLNPSYAKALKKKASASVILLNFDDALASLKQANMLEKTQATSNEIEDVEHFKSNYKKYQEAIQSGDFAEALSCVSYLCNKIVQNNDLKLSKIECQAKTGATEEASQSLRLFGQERTPEVLYLKGIIELYSGDSNKAQNYLAEGVRLDPENPKCQKALNCARKCQKLKEEGNQLLKANKWAEAEMKYTEAINLDPFNRKLNSVIYSNRALTFMKRKSWIKAAEDLNRSIEMNPKYLKAYVKRAEVNMERQQYSGAISDYVKIQELDASVNLKDKIAVARKKEKEAKKKDYYGILGIKKGASDQEIKKAYKKMALKYHPDRNRNKSEVEQEEASKKFKEICEANDVLTNPEKKKLYDSGQMQYDGDTGFENMGDMGAGFSNMGGFSSGGFSNMGGNTRTTFTMNGQEMGGIDPNAFFSMFMGDMGGMSGMGGMNRGAFGAGSKSNKRSSSQMPKGFEGFNFGSFGKNMGF